MAQPPRTVDRYKKFLYKLSQDVTSDKFEAMKFLCSPPLTTVDIEACQKVTDLFLKLETNGVIGDDKGMQFLFDLFQTVSCAKLSDAVKQFDESCRSLAAVHTPADGIVSNPVVRPNVESAVPASSVFSQACAKSSEVQYFDTVQTPATGRRLSYPVQATNSNPLHSVETTVKESSMDVEIDCGSAEHSASDSLNLDTAVGSALYPVEQLTPTSEQSSVNVDDPGIYSESSLMMSSLPSDTIPDTSVLSDTSNERLQPVVLRNYQKELARPGIQGQNCIICAPTGSGKTFTAGYISSSRRSMALEKKERFKALFIVCIRNLVQQQKDALRRVMPDGLIMGIDEKLPLSQCVSTCDVVLATAQVFVNALKSGEMKITDIDLLIMDECHHTDLGHPYNSIMAAYHDMRQSRSSSPRPKLPQIIGLTASLGVGTYQSNPLQQYIRICANLDCHRITHVRRETEFMEELLRFSPRPTRDQIISVQPRDINTPFVAFVKGLMVDVEKCDLSGYSSSFPHGSQQYENCIIGKRNDADKQGNSDVAAAADSLRVFNRSLMVYNELRAREALGELDNYFDGIECRASPRVRELYSTTRRKYLNGSSSENYSSICDNNSKLEKLCDLLKSLYENDRDPRGILLTRTRLSVDKLIDIIKEVPQLQNKVLPLKLVGQGDGDLTMTDVQQKYALEKFRLDRSDATRCNLLVATDVAQEGLDMPKCNFVIRYNFVSNEIGTVQSKGRARAPNSECYLIVERGSINEVREYQNLEKEHLMMQTLEDIDDEAEVQSMSKRIAEEQARMCMEREAERERRNWTSSVMDASHVTLHCRNCKVELCKATELRQVQSNYICISDSFLSRVKIDALALASQLDFRFDKHLGTTCCIHCNKKIGLQIRYKQGPRHYGYSLNKDSVMFWCDGKGEYYHIKKWSKVPFKIEEESLFGSL